MSARDHVQISKTQRWLDLIAYLVQRRLPVAVDEIMEGVPSYAEKLESGDDADREAVRRMFERDKDELRSLGIPLDSVEYSIDFGAELATGYRLRGRDFYLPYLRILREGRDELAGEDASSSSPGPRAPSPPESPASSPAGTVELDRDEAAAAADALRRVADLPGTPFAESARSGLRKLAWDLDLAGLAGSPVAYLDPPGAADVRDTVRTLLDAVRRRKVASFAYHGIYRGETTVRDVAPYGLLFHGGHWYLVGHDDLRDDLRVFRLGRMEGLEINDRAPKTPDYEVPDSFDLSAYAGREAWELGDEAEPVTARVRFDFPTSLLADRNDWGVLKKAMEGGAAVREFTVHQPGPFLRWILSQAGEARIEGPESLVRAYEDLVRRTRAVYDDPRGEANS